MSQAAIDQVMARLPREEGVKKFAYNDATGKQVTCKPGGNLSIGEGINLEWGLEPEEIDFLSRNRITKLDAQLQAYPWYSAASDPRQSVFLDVAFNDGLEGLMHFPHMLSAAAANDWDDATEELAVADKSLDASRYAPLRAILKAG